MNIDNNINIEINTTSENAIYRLVHKSLQENDHKKYVLECSHDNGQTFEDMRMFRSDTNVVWVAAFNSPKKARRFLKKILLSQKKSDEVIENTLSNIQTTE